MIIEISIVKTRLRNLGEVRMGPERGYVKTIHSNSHRNGGDRQFGGEDAHGIWEDL